MGFVVGESGVEFCRKLTSESKELGAGKLLVNARGSQPEYARVLREVLLIPV